MLWRLRAPVRSFLLSNCRRYSSTATKTAEPLKILFCGSDEFSVASLRALSKARQDRPELIESIDVVHRPPKPTGRGLKTLREVPISKVATEELKLQTHVIDTFTGWAPPVPINLVVAVSFGLFVPPRVLNLAKYGGLNVHPSLLPDLRGPAPIHHALLKGRRFTGVSVQTLHSEHFDRGMILAQTPSPGMEIPLGTTASELTERLGQIGSSMLVDVLRSRAFVPPLKDVGWYGDSGGSIDHAGKVTKNHRYIDFAKATVQDILTVKSVLGDPWCRLPNGDRLILNVISEANPTDLSPVQHKANGLIPGEICYTSSDPCPLVVAACGGTLRIERSTYEGGKTGQGNARLQKELLKQNNSRASTKATYSRA